MFMKKVSSLVVAMFIFLTVGIVLAPGYAHAATREFCQRESANFLKFPTWYKYLSPEFTDPDGDGPRPAECKVHFPKNSKGEEDVTQALGPILLAVVEILLRIAGMVAVAFVIYGGILYILSEGKPDKYGQALTTIISAAIGLAIAASAVVAVNIIGGRLI